MAKGFTKKAINKQDFLVLRKSRDGSVTNVIAPNGLQVGLADDRFAADLKVKGVIKAEGGVTGSLTKLGDGSDYLRAAAGGSISLVTGSDGSVTISAAGATIDISGLSTTLTDSDDIHDDLLAIYDFDAGTVKKITVESIIEFVIAGSQYGNSGFKEYSGRLYLDIDGLTEETINVAEDYIAFADGGTLYDPTRKESVADLISAIAGTVTTTGLAASSGVLSVDINNQSNVTAATGDEVLIFDATDNSLKKTTVGSIQNAGQQLDIAGLSGTLTDSTLNASDLFAVADVNDSNTVKKLDIEDLAEYMVSQTSWGLAESSGRLYFKPSALGTASPDVSADYLVIQDADSGSSLGKRTAISSVVSAMAGSVTTSGLAASSGVLNIDITNQGTLTLHDDDELLVWDDDASALKKTTVSALNQSIPLNSLSAAAINVAADSFGFIDADDSNTSKKESIADLISAIAGGGLAATSGVLNVDLQEFSEAAIAVGTDYMVFIDGGASGTSKKESVSDFVSGVAGSGLSASSGQLSLDFGSSSGQAAQGNSTIAVVAGDGLKSGGTVSVGTGGSVQLDIKVGDFAGSGLKVSTDDLMVDDSIVATVSGSTFSGVVNFNSGLSGSLTTLADGTPYLIGSPNIQLTTGSNGAITFTATAAGGLDIGTITGVTAGTGLSGGGTDGTVTLNIDHSEFSVLNTTAADDDYVLVVDITDSTLKKVLVSNLPGDIQGITAGTGLSGGGTSGTVTLNVDLSSLSSATPSPGADSFIMADADDSDATKKGSMSDFVAATAGNGLTATNGVLAVNDAIVATISGSVFSGHVGVTGSIEATSYVSGSLFKAPALSGSLTRLHDGSSYLVAGTGISIATGSSGQVTITGNVGDITGVTAGTGLSGGGSSGDVTLTIDNSVLATLSGSQFSGNVGITGSLGITGGLSGSLTHLSDGSSYLVAGSNVTLVTGSSGAVTISASASDTTYSAGTGLSLSGTEFSVDNTVTATLTGSTFSGTVTAPALSGSLTRLSDGSSYLVAGTNVTIATGSSGAVTITAADTDTTYSSSDFTHDDLTGFVANEHIDWTASSAGTIHTTNYTNTTYSVGDGGLTQNNFTNDLKSKLDGIAAGASVLAVTSGSTSVPDVSAINFDNFGLVQDLGSNQIAITGSIGPAEDGSYSAGLFSDFTPNTTVGTAIDRFNEVLKGLAPAAAPSLDDATCVDSGTSAKLSFGSSQSISGYTNALPSGLTPTDNLSDININGTYSSGVTSNDVRRACFAGATVINGTLNDDISADGVNYAADSFGNGDQGTLKLYVNDNSTEIHSVNLGSFGSGNSLNGDSSGFNLSAATVGHFSDSSNFDTFQHRQGTYIITAASQRNGWNYARVTHTVGSSTTTTNYIEWVNDSDNNALAAAGSAMDTLSMTGTKNLSGVKYNTGGTAQYRIRITNAYRNVYSTSNITFSETNCSIPNQAFPSINHAGGEDETKVLHLTGSVTITGDPILNGSISANTTVPHPLKSNLSSVGSQSISGILLYNLSDTSSITSESFRGESYRLVSGSYANQAAVSAGGNAWDSTTSLATVDGLLYYNSRLYAPAQGGVSGDFRNSSDGGSISNGPSSNVNYSGLTSGTRTFYRKFQNNSGGSKTNFDLTINGSGTIVSHGTAFSSSRIKVFVKLPETSSSFATGWMDLATAFGTGQVSDGDGCLAGSLDSSLNATNEITFGTQSIGDDEWVVVIIKTDASFTGYISSMSVSWS